MHSFSILDRRVVDIPDVEQAPAEIYRRQEEFSGERVPGGDDHADAARRWRYRSAQRRARCARAVDRQATFGVGDVRPAGRGMRDRDDTRLLHELHERTEDLSECLNRCNSRRPRPRFSRSSAAYHVRSAGGAGYAGRVGGTGCARPTQPQSRAKMSDVYELAATYGHSAEVIKFMRARRFKVERGNVVGRVVLEGKALQLEDVQADPEFTYKRRQELSACGQCWAFPFSAKDRRSASLYCRGADWSLSPTSRSNWPRLLPTRP